MATRSRQAGRRGPRKGDVKEKAILDTAERLLAERPLREIGVEELARAADISRSTFYFYFDSREAVLRALLERVGGELYAAGDWTGQPDETPEEAIRRSIESTVAIWREHGPLLRAAVETWGHLPSIGGPWQDLVQGLTSLTADCVREDRRKGLAPAGPPSAQALVTALAWMTERCLYTTSIGATPSLSERDLVRTLTTVWMRAIYAGGPDSG